VRNDSQNQDHNDISRLLGSLKQIDPPGDFDVRVRAKIAQGRPSARRGWFSATASATAGTAFLLVAGYFGYQSVYGPSGNQPQVSATQQSLLPIPRPQAVAEQPAQPVAEPEPDAQPAPREVASKPRSPEVRKTAAQTARQLPKPVKAEDGGGSVDMASSIPKQFSAIGGEADHSGPDWKVSGVKQNSAAERAGVKAGDVVIKMTDKFVRVRREGKVVDLPLKP